VIQFVASSYIFFANCKLQISYVFTIYLSLLLYISKDVLICIRICPNGDITPTGTKTPAVFHQIDLFYGVEMSSRPQAARHTSQVPDHGLHVAFVCHHGYPVYALAHSAADVVADIAKYGRQW
jgi:hypothetical protein